MSPDNFVQIINQYLPEPHASLLAGMLFGSKYSRMPEELYQALIKTGVLHVVALSGTNITILIRLFEKIAFPLGKKVTAAVTLTAITGFVFLVGGDPPIVRAAIMGGITALTGLAGRRSQVFLTLLFASGCMLLVKPDWLYSLSFQLSFLATLGIILFDTKKVERDGKSKIKIVFIESLQSTLAAQVLITPLLVWNFGRLSLIAPLTNALTLWSVEFITIFGVFLVCLGGWFFWLGKIIAWIVWVFLEYFILVVKLTAEIPFGAIEL